MRVIFVAVYAALLLVVAVVALLVALHRQPVRHPNPWLLAALVVGFPLVFVFDRDRQMAFP